MRPALLLDVDGVLIPRFKCKPPYCKCHPHWKKRRAYPDGIEYKLILNPRHGRQLTDLAREADAELMWASYWNDYANYWVAPTVGLTRLPFVQIPPLLEAGPLGGWKARHVAAHMGTRPFVWFDDEPDVAEALAAIDGVGEHLVVAVNERTGLEEDHLAQALRWLTSRPAGV